ncbi:MFS transporter [Streptomyces sp. NPDC017405]|uniref:MFS transporter n=1 Tax=unclassified Streptomyces TaxID=2593676 RepID=UPI0037937CE9
MSGRGTSAVSRTAWQVGGVGVAAQAVAYGFARYGYGLFLPDLRDRFGLSTSVLGLVNSVSNAGYLVALLLVGTLVSRLGPRPMVVAAGVTAGIGMVTVALAGSTWVLVVGFVVAGMASGFSWAPFSDTADRLLPDRTRERVMALIPSGTAFGVTVAGPLALVTRGANWRYAWLGFALVAFAMAWYAARVLPAGRHEGKADQGGRTVTARWFLRPAAAPLYLTAFVYGVIGAFYWTFALEAVSDAAGKNSPVAPLFWTLMGLAGIGSVLAGAFFLRLGLRLGQAVLFLALSAAIALLGLAPGALAAVVASAVLYGPAFMAASSLLALWSYRVFPGQPSTGFSATVLALGLGTLTGPVSLGAVADRYGVRTAFLVTAAVALVTLALRPPARRPGDDTARRPEDDTARREDTRATSPGDPSGDRAGSGPTACR